MKRCQPPFAGKCQPPSQNVRKTGPESGGEMAPEHQKVPATFCGKVPASLAKRSQNRARIGWRDGAGASKGASHLLRESASLPRKTFAKPGPNRVARWRRRIKRCQPPLTERCQPPLNGFVIGGAALILHFSRRRARAAVEHQQ